MAINKKLINFNMTYDQFKSHANGLNNQTSINTTNNTVGNVYATSIVFLNDGIWTHNKFIKGFSSTYLNNYVTLSGADQTISGNKTFTSNVSIDSLTAGNFTVQGSASFANTINGNIKSADKINTDAGSTSQPVYFKDGVPVATTYSLNKTVPSDAVFTDTHYTTHLYVGNTGATSNATSNTDNPYLSICDNSTNRDNIQIVGGGSTTVKAKDGIITISSTYSNTASAVDGILDGSNSGTAITYAPYTSQQSKLSFDTSTTNPTRSDRLNLNGYLYATKLYSGGKEVLTTHQSLANYVTLDTAQTISGAKTFSNPINGNLLGNASTADRLKNDVEGETGTGWKIAKIEGGIIKYYNTNTWNANSKDVAGYVAAPGAVSNKVWKTDANGNPAWRDDSNTWKAATTSQEGYVPQLALSGTSAGAKKNTIDKNTDDYVLTYTNGSETAPVWRKLPANAYKNDNTNYYVSSAKFEADTTNNNVKMTLTRTGDSGTVTANIPVMTAASESAAGKSGLVPAPAAKQQGLYLRGDGTWATPTNTNNAVTQTATDTGDYNYELLFSATADNTTRTEGAKKTQYLLYNPTNKLLTATNITLSGLLDVNGTAEIDSLIAGNLTVQGILSGSLSNSLVIKLAGGTTEGTDMFTFNNSESKTVDITKSKIGLGNVENKSSATIRSELTSSNVTTALGYTPYNSTNPNGYITASNAKFNNYLLLSGGTIDNTGFAPLTIYRNGSANAAVIAFKNSNGVLGYLGMTGSVDGHIKRYETDTSKSYNLWDTSDFTSTNVSNWNSVYTWYSAATGDTDTVINKWKEVEAFLAGITDTQTLNGILNGYVTLGTTQTITGAKTFSNPISGNLLGNASTADRLKNGDVGSSTNPVYFSGGLPVATGYNLSTISSNATNGNTAYGWGNHANAGYLKSHQDITGKVNKSGDVISGDLTFSTISSWPAATDQKYPISSAGLKWSGESDAASIFYRLNATNNAALVLKVADDGDETIDIDFGSTTKLKIKPNDSSIYPTTTNTGSLGTSSFKWANVYATTFNGNLSGNALTATNVAWSGVTGKPVSVTDMSSGLSPYSTKGTGAFKFLTVTLLSNATQGQLDFVISAKGLNGTSQGRIEYYHFTSRPANTDYRCYYTCLGETESDTFGSNIYIVNGTSTVDGVSYVTHTFYISYPKINTYVNYANIKVISTDKCEKIEFSNTLETTDLPSSKWQPTFGGKVAYANVAGSVAWENTGHPDWIGSSKPTYTLDNINDGTTRKLSNYLPLTGGAITGTISSTRDADSTNKYVSYWEESSGVMVFRNTKRAISDNSFIQYEDLCLGTTVDGLGNKGLYYDASAKKWGIGKTNPSYEFDVSGSINGTSLYLNGTALSTAATHAHGDYVTSLSWDSTNNKLKWAKGGTDQTAITIGYATNAGNSDTVDSYHAYGQEGAYLIKQGVVFPASGDTRTWFRVATLPAGVSSNNRSVLLYIDQSRADKYALVRIRHRGSSSTSFTFGCEILQGNFSDIRLYHTTYDKQIEIFVKDDQTTSTSRSINTRVLAEYQRGQSYKDYIKLDNLSGTDCIDPSAFADVETSKNESGYVKAVYVGTVNSAGSATTATNLTNKPSLSFTAATSSSAGSTLTVTAGEKTSDSVTISKVRSAFAADSSSYANYLNVVASNEIRFNSNKSTFYDQATDKNVLHINHAWADSAPGYISEYDFKDGHGSLTNVKASKFIGALQGNADTATTATTAATATHLRQYRHHDNTTDWASYPWHKVADVTIENAYNDRTIAFYVQGSYANQYEGILRVRARTDGNKLNNVASIVWDYATANIDVNSFVLVYTNNTNSDTTKQSTTYEIWCKHIGQHHAWQFTVLTEGDRSNFGNYWNLYNSDGHGQASHTTGTKVIVSELASLKNKVDKASALQLNSGLLYNYSDNATANYRTDIPTNNTNSTTVNGTYRVLVERMNHIKDANGNSSYTADISHVAYTESNTARTLMYRDSNGNTNINTLIAAGELKSTSANAIRLKYSNYGVIFRHDGGSFYALLTNKDDLDGSWNSLRPLQFNLSNGYMIIGNGLTLKGTSSIQGATSWYDATDKYLRNTVDINAPTEHYGRISLNQITPSSTTGQAGTVETKLQLAVDSEGGNIRIFSPTSTTDANKYYYTNTSGTKSPNVWEIDAHDGNLRFFTKDLNGTTTKASANIFPLILKRDGKIYGNLTGNVTGNVSGSAGSVAWTNVTGKPNLVTLDTTQTITGAKTFSNPINGNLLGNASTADRLKNAVTLWGQSFDGSANVTSAPNLYIGTTKVQTSSAVQNITGTGHVTPSSAGSYDIGSNTLSYRYGYFTWVGAPSSTNLTFGANNATHAVIDTGGNFRPNVSNSYILGTSSYYWRGAYIGHAGNIALTNLTFAPVGGVMYETTDTNRGFAPFLMYGQGSYGNKVAGMPAAAVTLEYTTNGSTWVVDNRTFYNSGNSSTVNGSYLSNFKRQMLCNSENWYPVGGGIISNNTAGNPYQITADAGSGKEATDAVGYGCRVTLDFTVENRTFYMSCIMPYWRIYGDKCDCIIEYYNKNSNAWTTIKSTELNNSNQWRQLYLDKNYYVDGARENRTTMSSTDLTPCVNKLRFTVKIKEKGAALASNANARYLPGIAGIYIWGVSGCGMSSGSVTISGKSDPVVFKNTTRMAYVLSRYNVPIYVNGSANDIPAVRIPAGTLYIGDDLRYTAANTAKYATLLLGNSSNINAENAHEEGRIQLYSAATSYHMIYGASTTTAYTHTFPNATGWVATGGNGSSTGVGDSTHPVYLSTSGVLTQCSALPASGGNADTVGGYSASDFVLDAKTNGAPGTSVYSIGCKKVFTCYNMPDAPSTTAWISGLVLGADWNDNHYQHYIVDVHGTDNLYHTKSHASSKMKDWLTILDSGNYTSFDLAKGGWYQFGGSTYKDGDSTGIVWTKIASITTNKSDNIENDMLLEISMYGNQDYPSHIHGYLRITSYSTTSTSIVLSTDPMASGQENIRIYATIDSNRNIWIGRKAYYTCKSLFRVLQLGTNNTLYYNNFTEQRTAPNSTYITSNGSLGIKSGTASSNKLLLSNVNVDYATTAGGLITSSVATGYQLQLKGSTTSSNAINSATPRIEFCNSDRSQYCQLVYTDYDSVQAPDSLTLIGNQSGTYFIAPNIKATNKVTASISEIDSLTAGNLVVNGSSSVGTITSGTWNGSVINRSYLDLGGKANTNQTMYIGTTAVAINRSSGSLSLTGVSIDGSSGSCTGRAASATNLLVKEHATNATTYYPVWANGIDDTNGNGTVRSIYITKQKLQFIPSSGSLKATAMYNISDIRLKNIQNYLNVSIYELSKLPIFDFTWNDGTTGVNSGTSAQEVQKILPNLITSDDSDKLTLNYAALGTIEGIVCARKLVEHEDEIQKLKSRIKELEEKLMKYGG